jgi:acyl-coenzyme A synthetase/AMP-(fatty) acid ligase
MHLAEMVLYWAKATPEQRAIIQPDSAWTYRDMANAIVAVSERLKSFVFEPHEPVAVTVSDPAKRLAVCLALFRRGVSAAPINQRALPFLHTNGINTVIDSGGGQVLSGGRNIQFQDSWLRPKEAVPPTLGFDQVGLGGKEKVVFFSSGTTGIPTMITLPHAAIMDRIALRPISGELNSTRVLVVPGVSSAFGFLRTAELLWSGKTVCYGGDPNTMLQMIELFGVETIIASPQQILSLLNCIDRERNFETTALKEVVIGGSFASPELFRRVQTSLCRQVVYNYGSTEAGLIALARYSAIEGIPNAVGFPAPGVVVQIVDEDDNPVLPGTEGRIRCRTNYFARAYIEKHPQRANDLENIWWYSGDLGRMTEDGVLCVLGRADDVINLGGVKVSGALLDDIVQGVPGVKDAGVCVGPGASGVDELWVAIVPALGAIVSTIRELIVQMPEFRPHKPKMFLVDRVPRNDLGKLSRQELRKGLIGARKQPPH